MTVRRPLHWILFLSLALNLFCGGVIAAYHLRWSDGTTRSRSQIQLEQLAETLPRQDAAKLEAVFRSHAAEMSEYTAAIRRAQERQRDLLRAEPFDVKAVAAVMTATRLNHDAAKRVVHEVILRAAEDMSPEGRARLAEWSNPR